MGDECPLDLTLSNEERQARQKYLKVLESNPDFLGCWDCLMVFSDPLIFTLHTSTHAPGRRLVCACGETFAARRDFQRHVIEKAHPV